MNTCRKVGCNQSFKFRIQRDRHHKKCSFPEPDTSNLVRRIVTEIGLKCSKCERLYSSKTTFSRHKKCCHIFALNPTKKKKLNYGCDICKKEFITPSKLNRHKLTHKTKFLVCPGCQQVYKRQDHYNKHKSSCDRMIVIQEEGRELKVEETDCGEIADNVYEQASLKWNSSVDDVPSFINQSPLDFTARPSSPMMATNLGEIFNEMDEGLKRINPINEQAPRTLKSSRCRKTPLLQTTLNDSIHEVTSETLVTSNEHLTENFSLSVGDILQHIRVSLCLINRLKKIRNPCRGISLGIVDFAKELYKVFGPILLEDADMFTFILKQTGVDIQNLQRIKSSMQLLSDNDFRNRMMDGREINS